MNDGNNTAGDVLTDPCEIRGRERSEWKRRQALQPAPPRRVEPTVHDRIQRLNPQARYEVRMIVRSLLLRKTIRSVLAQSYWLGAPLPPAPPLNMSNSLQRLERTVKEHESLMNYGRALTSFEPLI